MTAKRYHKLFRAEMSKLMAHKYGAAACLRAAATATPFPGRSYAESWDVLRAAFTYGGNVPPVK